MSTQAIIESGMTFGPYPAGQCFYIEKSKCYSQIQEGVKMVEFLLLMPQKKSQTMWVIEAKSSSPRPENQPNFSAFIEEVRTKLTNGFLLAVAALLQRHQTAVNELSAAFKAFDLKTQNFRFVLVINGHEPASLEALQNALAKALKPLVKTWALPPCSVAVLNHVSALKYGLILPAVGTDHEHP